MSFQSKPTKDGQYHIKVLNQNLYLEAIPKAESTASTPWMKLAAPSSSNKQKWTLIKVPNSTNQWTIASGEDQAGLIYKKTSQTYRGYGFPYPGGQSLQWAIQEYNSQYSKISAVVNGSDCFDSQYRNQGDDAVHFWNSGLTQSAAPFQCYVFEYLGGDDEFLKMDVLFIQDATGSQQPYINAARDQVTQICLQIKAEGNFASDDDLRFGLVTFRDHPPQDTTFISQIYPFNSNISVLQSNLASLVASGGGDGPEAQCDALNDALNAAWRNDAAKLVMLITDSPPHGVEDSGDGFPDGCPLQNDPVRTADLMADADIILNVIACEPTLSTYYSNAIDFYRGLVDKTQGDIIPLGNADPLQKVATGFVIKALDTAKFAAKYRSTIQQQALSLNRSASDIAADLHRDMLNSGVHHHAVSVENIYEPNEQGNKNSQIWTSAKSLKEAKTKIQGVQGQRIAEEHRSGGTFAVTSEKQPITRDNVNRIVSTVLKQANRKK